MARGTVFWTPERLDKLRELIEQGKSYREIAKYFGKSVSSIKSVVSRHRIRVTAPVPPEHRIKRDPRSLAEKIAEILGAEEKIEKVEESDEFSEEDIMRWRNDYAEFVRDVLKIELQDYQKKMFRMMQNEKRCLFVMGRASGKTFTVGAFVLAYAMLNPGSTVLIVGPSLRQSRVMFDTVVKHIHRSEAVYRSVSAFRKVPEFSIELKNGSSITALPCGDKGNLLRGLRADVVIVEEAAFVPEEIFSVIEPFLAVSGGKMILISTPGSKSGYFYRAFISGNYAKLQLPSAVNRFIDREWLERMEDEMTPETYRREILAEFTESSGLFFRPETIERCLSKYDFLEFPEKGRTYYAGIDWGRFHDSSAVVIVSKGPEGDLRVDNIIELENKPFKAQVMFIELLHRKYRFARICAEYAGLGIAPSEELRALGLPVEFVKPTVEKKQDIFLKLQKVMEEGRIKLPARHRKLLFQMKNFGFEITSRGMLKLHHITEEIGDDLVDALSYAVHAAERGFGAIVVERGL